MGSWGECGASERDERKQRGRKEERTISGGKNGRAGYEKDRREQGVRQVREKKKKSYTRKRKEVKAVIKESGMGQGARRGSGRAKEVTWRLE